MPYRVQIRQGPQGVLVYDKTWASKEEADKEFDEGVIKLNEQLRDYVIVDEQPGRVTWERNVDMPQTDTAGNISMGRATTKTVLSLVEE